MSNKRWGNLFYAGAGGGMDFDRRMATVRRLLSQHNDMITEINLQLRKTWFPEDQVGGIDEEIGMYIFDVKNSKDVESSLSTRGIFSIHQMAKITLSCWEATAKTHIWNLKDPKSTRVLFLTSETLIHTWSPSSLSIASLETLTMIFHL